jgi:methyltransferase
MRTAAVLLAAFLPLALEARLAARHERALVALGAREPVGDVYRAMRIAYPACFLAMALEGWIRSGPGGAPTLAGVAMFALAKTLKYWAVATLGPRWTFRVLVPPQSTRIASGPYRFLRHPNYIAVAGELVGIALAAGAPITGTVGTLGFCVLMWRRIGVEDRALARTGA